MQNQDCENKPSTLAAERIPLLVDSSEEAIQVVDEAQVSSPNTEGSPKGSQYRAGLFEWRPLVAIVFISLVQPLCFELIFPFVNQMIVENGIVDDPDKVGYYSGFIESIFQVMSFLAVLPCSFISDHYGRKAIVLLGTLGMALSIALFGMSKTYWMMIVTRCIGGTLGGTASTLKVMLGEIYTRREQRTRAFSIFQIAYRVGQVIGQPLGGLLSHPANNLNNVGFNTPFWREYPFALPCFVAAVIALASTVWSFFTLQETLSSKSTSLRNTVQSPSDGMAEARLEQPTIRSAATPHVLSVLASLSIMSLTSEVLFVLYPLFAFTPITSGGLGFSEAQIGIHMTVRAVLHIIILFAYAPVCAWLGGAVRCYQVGMVMWSLVVAGLPVLNALARTGSGPGGMGVGTWVFDAAVLVVFAIWSLASLAWPSSQIVVIEAPVKSEDLAIVNGLAQMVQSLMFAVAPAFATNLFAFTIENHILGGNLMYVMMLCLAVVAMAHSFTLREPDHGRE